MLGIGATTAVFSVVDAAAVPALPAGHDVLMVASDSTTNRRDQQADARHRENPAIDGSLGLGLRVRQVT
jgi:hypothetical protein